MIRNPPSEVQALTDVSPTSVHFDAGQAHEQYTALGYDAIPLKPLSKLPISKSWQNREPFRQWHNAPKDSNIGLRAGHGKAFIDCDDKNQPGTFSNVINWLEGLGYKRGEIPIVQTASGIGRHVYVNFIGSLFGSRRNFVSAIGAGDFRYGSASFVAAHPSIVEGGGQYKLLQGDLSNLPNLDIRDIETLIGKVNQEEDTPKRTPQMSARARSLAGGKGLEQYQSRSEAEAALVLSLVNSGFDFSQIKMIFDTSPAFGKYAELRTMHARKAEAYLLTTHKNAVDFSQHESLTRRTILDLQDLAERAAWSKTTDKLVFIAHTQIAYRAGRLEYAASSRDLALQAGLASNDTAIRATRRLIGNALLKLEEKNAAIFANRYALQMDKIAHFLTSTFLGSVRECPLPAQVVDAGRGLMLDLKDIETADAFRNGKGKLGRRAGQIYKLLFTESLTNSEIARRTGASSKTVQRILKKLSAIKDYKTGEILELVSRGEGGRWHSNVVDLELLEAIYGTRGARAKQRSDYERERRDHIRDLELGQASKG